MSDEWETTSTSRQRREQRRRKEREKGPPANKSQSVSTAMASQPLDDMLSKLSISTPPAAEGDAEAKEDMPSSVEFPKPFVLLLAGLPGSGKSTLSEQLVNANSSKYVHVNQDALKTRQKCLSAVRNAVLAGKVPITDRCNFDATQRRWFIDLARQELGGCAVHCVVLVHVDPSQCLYRCQQRRGHPTLPPSNAAKVIGFMKKDWRLPTEKEGIDRIWIVNDEQQYQAVVAFYS